MPRPKGSKKIKNQSTPTIPPPPPLTPPLPASSSSRTSMSSPLSFSQTSALLSNDLINDETNWIKTPTNSPTVNRGGRPRKIDLNNGNDENANSPASSSSEISGGRVVVNPAVLRYLEQNRNVNYSSPSSKTNEDTDEFLDKHFPMGINEEKEDASFDDLLKSFAAQDTIPKHDTTFHPPTPVRPSFNERPMNMDELIELDKLIQDDLFWDFCACSTDFLTTARLAEWILNHQSSTQYESRALPH